MSRQNLCWHVKRSSTSFFILMVLLLSLPKDQRNCAKAPQGGNLNSLGAFRKIMRVFRTQHRHQSAGFDVLSVPVRREELRRPSKLGVGLCEAPKRSAVSVEAAKNGNGPNLCSRQQSGTINVRMSRVDLYIIFCNHDYTRRTCHLHAFNQC